MLKMLGFLPFPQTNFRSLLFLLSNSTCRHEDLLYEPVRICEELARLGLQRTAEPLGPLTGYYAGRNMAGGSRDGVIRNNDVAFANWTEAELEHISTACARHPSLFLKLRYAVPGFDSPDEVLRHYFEGQAGDESSDEVI